MKIFTITITAFFMFAGCSQNKAKNENIKADKFQKISINVLDVDNNIIEESSKILDVIEYIPLQTINKVVVGEIEKLIEHNGLYFVYDRLSSCIYTFDKNGTHISTISAKGKGPREYLEIDAFSIDRTNGNVLIFDNRQRKLLTYNLKGDFIMENKVDASVRDIVKSKEGIFLNTEYLWNKNIFNSFPKQYQLIYLTDNNDIISQDLGYMYSDFLCKYPRISNKFSSISDSLLYIDDVGNKIYNLFDDGAISERYTIDFGKMTIPLEYSKIDKIEDINYLNKLDRENKLAVLREFIETRDHICLKYSFHTLIWTYFYSKITKNKANIPLIIYDKDGIQIPLPSFSTDSTFISVINAYELKQAYERSDMTKSERITNLYNRLNPTDNPVLAIIKMREKF